MCERVCYFGNDPLLSKCLHFLPIDSRLRDSLSHMSESHGLVGFLSPLFGSYAVFLPVTSRLWRPLDAATRRREEPFDSKFVRRIFTRRSCDHFTHSSAVFIRRAFGL